MPTRVDQAGVILQAHGSIGALQGALHATGITKWELGRAHHYWSGADEVNRPIPRSSPILPRETSPAASDGGQARCGCLLERRARVAQRADFHETRQPPNVGTALHDGQPSGEALCPERCLRRENLPLTRIRCAPKGDVASIRSDNDPPPFTAPVGCSYRSPAHCRSAQLKPVSRIRYLLAFG